MKIIKPSFELLDLNSREQGVDLLRRCEYLGRISHRAEEKQTETSWERFIRTWTMERGDWSFMEHCSVTAIARVDRGVTHEWVRHRIGAYTQESTRFVRYGDRREIEFIEPEFAEVGETDVAPKEWRNAMIDAERNYNNQLAFKQPPEIARSVLPNAIASTIAVTYNLRNWRHFFMMRTTKETHRDFRRVTLQMLQLFKERIPLLYDDIEPLQQQSASLARAR